MPTQEPRYLAYLLRLWQVRDNDKFVWCASLENARTGERRGFGSLGLLFEFLEQLANSADTHTRQLGTTTQSD